MEDESYVKYSACIRNHHLSPSIDTCFAICSAAKKKKEEFLKMFLFVFLKKLTTNINNK